MRKFDVVEAWLDNVAYAYSRNDSTPSYYRYRFGLFCKFVERTPQQILADYKSMTDREFRRVYAQFLRTFVSDLSKQQYAPGTVRANVTAVKSFFKYNDLPLGYVPVGRNRIIYHNRDITREEILEILKASRPRDKSYFCIMAQSGLRPVTLSQLRRKHIEPDFSEGVIPCRIDVPEELAKGKFGAYFTFMGDESAKYLETYFKMRRGVHPEDYLFVSHGTDEPVNSKSMSNIFVRTLEELAATEAIKFEQKETGKPRDVRLYNLRKFFRKQAGHAGVEYVNFWMGHKTNYKAPHIPASDDHYFSREDVEFHRQLFVVKAMPNLRLEKPSPLEMEVQIEKLRQNIDVIVEKQVRERVAELREELASVKREREADKERMERIADRLDALE